MKVMQPDLLVKQVGVPLNILVLKIKSMLYQELWEKRLEEQVEVLLIQIVDRLFNWSSRNCRYSPLKS